MAPKASPDAVLSALAARRLLIVSGKGGVGRTAVAAMLGTMSAVLGRQSPSQRNARRRISTLNAA